MKLHMIDTDCASYAIKNRPGFQSKLNTLRPYEICVSVLTRAELLYGLMSRPLGHPLRVGVARFLELVQTLTWDEAAAGHYAVIRHQLTMTGKLIGQVDMMIAAHALAAGATLVTNNVRHFSRIAELPLANWTESPESRH